MKEIKLIGGIFGSSLSASSLALSSAELDHIVSIVCAITGIAITVITCILIPFIKWLKKAKADGKITKEELEEGKEIISNGVEEVKDALDKKKK